MFWLSYSSALFLSPHFVFLFSPQSCTSKLLILTAVVVVFKDETIDNWEGGVIIREEDSPALPSIPQYKALIFSSSDTFLSGIIKSQTDNLSSMGSSGVGSIMVYSIMKHFSWFEPTLLVSLP